MRAPDECRVCRKQIGRVLVWGWRCDRCKLRACGEHHRNGHCTVCLADIEAVVAWEDSGEGLGEFESIGVIVSQPRAELADALFDLKKRSLERGATVLTNVSLESEDKTFPRAAGLDELKSGNWSQQGSYRQYTLRGEAFKKREPVRNAKEAN